MIGLLIAIAITLVAILGLSTSVQILYLESMRLRTRETKALEFFKETLEDRLGLETEQGALAFSLIKHTTMVVLGVVCLGITAASGAPVWESIPAACVLSAIAILVATYMVPQVLYRRSSGHWMSPLVPFYRALALLVAPLAWLLNFSHSLIELGNGQTPGEQPTDPSEHIDALIEAGTEEGIIEEDDRKLIQSVVAFGDKTVREVMTPRPSIVAIQQDKTLEDLRQLVIHEQYSRIPVYEETIDQVIGFVHVRDMFELDRQERQRRTVKELARHISHVPETKPVDDLLREMQKDGAHMAVVVDEYGNTAGLATMEDLVEEILGEIRDEHEPTLDVEKDPDGSYIVSGSFSVDRLEELLDFRAAEDTESTTVAGLITEWMGRVPTVGEAAERGGIRIEVLAGNELRVEQVRVSRTAETTA